MSDSGRLDTIPKHLVLASAQIHGLASGLHELEEQEAIPISDHVEKSVRRNIAEGRGDNRMRARLIRRRGHNRRLRSGRLTYVRDCYELRGSRKGRQKNSDPRKCPRCGAPIISVPMPNGGWAHFEGEKGLTRVKHPCMHVGEGISRSRDNETLDMFDEIRWR